MSLSISIIVTTYNRPDALAATLRGLADQRSPTADGGFEVLIADDGSTGETADLIRRLTPAFPVPLEHVWHADQGFRAAAIRNRAIAASSGDYVVLIDGDCIPRPCFVARHRVLAREGMMVGGSRILLSETLTAEVLADDLPIHRWPARRWLVARARGDTNRILPLLWTLPDGRWRCRRPRDWRSLRTFNLGVARQDLLRVDGLDESYVGWGSEDSDLIIRLMHAGVRIKSGRFSSPMLHLWHPPASREAAAGNQDELQEVLRGHRIRARQGLSSA